MLPDDVLMEGGPQCQKSPSRVFWGSLIAIAGGLILLAIPGGVGFAGPAFIMRGSDVVGVQPTSLTWMAGSFAIVAIVGLISGVVAQLVA
jgi:hypothetical protein